MTLAYLGLGSNVGDRLSSLRTAVGLLGNTEGVDVLACSSIYETEPVGAVPEQRDFYNAVVKVGTDLAPHDLLRACKGIERELGRDLAGPRHGARTIDLDLLLMGGLSLADGRLVLPHPEVVRRRFVLVPLLELEPGLTLPDGTVLAGVLAHLGSGTRVVRVGGGGLLRPGRGGRAARAGAGLD